MASPSTPTHAGKYGALYRLRPNGFSGDGLNDVTWGTGYSGAGSSAYFEVEIDGEGTPDTFRWRKNGGGWTSLVAITGAAQTLSDSQTITFAATTGHTSGDKWAIGNLDTEATTESSDEAQITDSTKRLLNPNSPPTFTDAGGKVILQTGYAHGWGKFTGNVGVVTVSGNNGYIVESYLEKIGYLIDWNFQFGIDMADASRMGQKWKESLPGLAHGNGGANGYYVGTDTLWELLEKTADTTQKYWLLQLFNYDPDQDQTGDHWNMWVTIKGFNVNAPIGEVIKEGITFDLHGIPNFVANS